MAWETLDDLSIVLQKEANRLLIISTYDWPDPEVGDAYASLSAALNKLDHQMYLAYFLANDAKIAKLASLIKEAGEEADELNQLVDQAVEYLKTARKITQTANQAIGEVSARVQGLREKIDTALAMVEKALKYFGLETA